MGRCAVGVLLMIQLHECIYYTYKQYCGYDSKHHERTIVDGETHKCVAHIAVAYHVAIHTRHERIDVQRLQQAQRQQHYGEHAQQHSPVGGDEVGGVSKLVAECAATVKRGNLMLYETHILIFFNDLRMMIFCSEARATPHSSLRQTPRKAV